MAPETQAGNAESLATKVDALITAAQEAAKLRRRANIFAAKVFLGSLAITTLASWILCDLFVQDRSCVRGLSLFYSLLGFLFSYMPALIIHHRIVPPAPK